MKSKIYWYQNLSGGMNLSSDPAMVDVKNNESPLLQNVTLDQLGNWVKRKGTTKLGSTTAGSDRIWGLFAYNDTAGNRTFFRVCNRDLEKYDGSADWDITDADEWTASKKVNAVNYLNRLYLGCEDGTTALAYCTAGGTLTDITPTIGGHILAVSKNRLVVGGNSLKPNVLFYSDPFTDTFHSATGTCAANADSKGAKTVLCTTDIFEPDMEEAFLYNTTDGAMVLITGWTNDTIPYVTTDGDTSGWNNDTVYVLQNNVKLDNACTAMAAYGENLLVWDADKMYRLNITNSWSDEHEGFGCVNDRVAKVVNGHMLWCNRDGIYLYTGSSAPIDITAKIRDRVDGYGIWDLINNANWGSVAAGVDKTGTKYELSLGTLSTLSGAPASAMTNCCLVFDTGKNTFHVKSRNTCPVVYAKWIDGNGAEETYFGEKDALAVYKDESGTTDATSAGGTANITADFRTPHYNLGDPTVKWRPVAYYFKYKAGGDVTVTLSQDRGAYGELETLPASSSVTVVKVLPPTDKSAFTYSVKFSTTSTFTLEALGFEVMPHTFEGVAT